MLLQYLSAVKIVIKRGIFHTMSEDHQFRVNSKTVKSAPGNCKSYNIIYLVQCSICQKEYVGRTTRFLHVRMREHRKKYYDVLRGKKVDDQTSE